MLSSCSMSDRFAPGYQMYGVHVHVHGVDGLGCSAVYL